MRKIKKINKPFEAFEPEVLIKEAIKRYGDNIAVACSFGISPKFLLRKNFT